MLHLTRSTETRMKRSGFTLIELLIVIVIIGILALIAIPAVTKAKQRAYFKSVVADLRTLGTQQELYYTLPEHLYNYAATPNDLPDFTPSGGVLIDIVSANTHGWVATGSHMGLDAANQQCGIYHGAVASPPAYLTSAGVVACTGE